MARTENQTQITPSVLDRLIDLDPRESREAPRSRTSNVTDLRQAVRRDLEWLLNTRTIMNPADSQLEEAKRSVAFYGLPDFTGIGASSNVEQRRLLESLETAIKTFEPRFLDVKIILEPMNELERQLRFRIEARLDVDPAPVPIAFDSVVQSGVGGFTVTER